MGGMVQHMYLSPLYTKMWFGLWDQVLAEPAPPADLPFLTAMSHAARGRAYAATGKLAEAEAERKSVAALRNEPSLGTLYVSSVNPASSIVAIADEVLAGEIDARRRRTASAIRHFADAVALEDGLIYMEPPDWPIPVRQLQGVALLDLRRYKEAEAAFRADMKKFPDNGWSLSGLQASLERQGRVREVPAVKERLAEQWKRADVSVSGGRRQP
jgi:tetratricopeptide (TPR) repeat protein